MPVHRDVKWPATISRHPGPAGGWPDGQRVGPRAGEPGLISRSVRGRPCAQRGASSVDLPVSFESLGGQDQQVAAAQIVFTVTTFTGVRGVRFLVGGQPAQVPTGDGSLTRGPSTRQDYAALEA